MSYLTSDTVRFVDLPSHAPADDVYRSSPVPVSARASQETTEESVPWMSAIRRQISWRLSVGVGGVGGRAGGGG